MGSEIWKKCLDRLEDEIPSQQFDTCIRPLQVEDGADGLHLFSPNKYIMDLVSDKFLQSIKDMVRDFNDGDVTDVSIQVGSKQRGVDSRPNSNGTAGGITGNGLLRDIDMEFTFATFVEGRSNVLARAAALQVAENVGTTYNPLLLYGGVGLGKTHLMCAVGNAIRERNPQAKVVYTNSQRFIEEMVRAIKSSTTPPLDCWLWPGGPAVSVSGKFGQQAFRHHDAGCFVRFHQGHGIDGKGGNDIRCHFG